MSEGNASILEVGLEIGRTIGRSTPAHIASMIGLVNDPWTVEVPSKIVGLTCLMVVSRSIGAPSAPVALHLGRRRPGVGLLVVPQVGHVVDEQALLVHQPDLADCLFPAGSIVDHGITQGVGDPAACGPRAEDHQALVPEGLAGDLQRRDALKRARWRRCPGRRR